MYNYPENIEALIYAFKQLPGIGRHGSERIVNTLLKWRPEQLGNLGAILTSLASGLCCCPECGAWSDNSSPCPVCADPKRDQSLLCVVETVNHLITIEKSARYNGRYLVLGGKISPMNAEADQGLNLALLKEKASNGAVKEVILAISPDVEGRATMSYIADMLRDCPVKVTSPAVGIPLGGNLSFSNAATLAAALDGRIEVELP